MDKPLFRNSVSPYVKGTSTIFGKCIRVGGSEPKVDVRLPNRSRLLHVKVTEEMARRLARNLYDNVAMTGEATWERDTWFIVNFRATSVVNIQSGTPLQAFKELGEMVGEKWKGIDVERFVEEMRSGERIISPDKYLKSIVKNKISVEEVPDVAEQLNLLEDENL